MTPFTRPPPVATPEELDDLYHPGGPFHVEGLARPLSRVVFRIGEIGNPVMTIAGQTIHLKQEAGFGGAVLLQARKPRPRLDGGLGEISTYLQDFSSSEP